MRDALVVNFSLTDFDDLLLELDHRLESLSTANGLDEIVKEVIYKAEKERWVSEIRWPKKTACLGV